MRNLVLLIATIVLFLVSCTGISGNRKTEEPHGDLPFLLRMNVFGTDAEKLVSFPVWFNDSIVEAQGIKKITRELHFIDMEDSVDLNALADGVPRERKEYFFHANGQLKEMKVTYFYDDQPIGSVMFTYTGGKDAFGYCSVAKTDDAVDWQETNEENMDFPYSMHLTVKKTDKFQAYRDVETGNYLFFMMNRKYWGPLSVDSILHPTYKDMVVLGNPYYPHKRYRVQNKVNEMDIQKVSYDKKTRLVTTIMRYEYPFEYKRSILYNRKGVCTGYVDSTFSGNSFLTRVISEMELNKRNNPIKITHRKENSLSKTGKISIELITYE